MYSTIEKTSFTEMLFLNSSGLIEVREQDRNGNTKIHFFRGLKDFKLYNPPQDKNVYVGIFTRSKGKGTKENCKMANVLWADFDHMTGEEAKKQIAVAGLPEASILINSGHGIHSYWLLEKSAGKEIECILKAIAERTQADSKAAEVARVMRLPGSNNVKDSKPLPCEVIEQNSIKYPLQLFIDLFSGDGGLNNVQAIPELESSKMACIRLIAKGVNKGQRNFCLGKITAYLKQQGYSYKKALEIVKRWNSNNDPVKPVRELTDEFMGFWNSDYKYLGCKFSNPELQKINKQLCPIGECQFHASHQAQVINDNESVAVDNEIFKDTVYPKIGALEIACYSWITREKELTKEQLSKYVNRHIRNDNFIKALRGLKVKGLIEIKKGTPQIGIADKVIIKSKSNYGRGHTLVPNLLTKLYTKKAISDNAYKLMVLLKSYSFGKEEVYPTIETMASKLGISERWVTELLKWLEDDEGLIKRGYKRLDNGKSKLIIKLLY